MKKLREIVKEKVEDALDWYANNELELAKLHEKSGTTEYFLDNRAKQASDMYRLS